MALITWDARLETGHPTIDEQHKALIDAYNALHNAMKQGKGKDELHKVLHFLADYTVSHFRMEEDLMNVHAYAGTQRHKELHADLVAKVLELIRKLEAGQAMLTLQVMDFLEGWLVEHIQGEDYRLAQALKA